MVSQQIWQRRANFLTFERIQISFERQSVSFKRRYLACHRVRLNNRDEPLLDLILFGDFYRIFPQLIKIFFGFFCAIIADFYIEFSLRGQGRASKVAAASDKQFLFIAVIFIEEEVDFGVIRFFGLADN